MKAKPYIFLLTLLTLTSLSITTADIKGLATRPTSAVVDDLNGTIWMQSGSGQPTRVQRNAELPASITLLVPRTHQGRTEHWAHLRFRSSSSRNITLVQAGTDTADSEYRFPCEYREGTGLWGVRRVGSNACDRITVNSGGWRSQLSTSPVAQKTSRTTTSSRIAQQRADAFTVIPDNRLTLLYVYQTPDSTILNVLAGSARVRSASRSYILRAGTRYIDYGDDDDGDTGPIPENVYTARAVQIFLDPNNWSDDLGGQIGEFQRAVDQTFATAPLAPPDPEPIFDPGPTDWDLDLFPDDSDDSDDSGDDNPRQPRDPNENPYPQQPEAPDTAPPVSNEILDGIPSDVFVDEGEIDYGGSSGQDEEFKQPN